MLVDCFKRILGTTWRVSAAIAEIWTQQKPIGANWKYQDFSHCLITLFQCFSRLLTSFRPSTSKIGRRTIMTISLAGKRCWFFLKLSLKTLFNLFLSTALWICFLAIANPSLGQVPGIVRTSIVILVSPTRILLLNTCR